jgi:NAD(P)-dependent dehydrogenase (short-subunit alcohol dehydrogenase family)
LGPNPGGKPQSPLRREPAGSVAHGPARLGSDRELGATSAFVRSHSVYGLAKAALLHLTESLALELAPTITVNAVVPSQIASARTDRMPAYKAAAIKGTPLGRLVTEGEIARMVALLCSPAFDFVTGHTIVMDGGRTLPVFPRIAASLSPESPRRGDVRSARAGEPSWKCCARSPRP